MLLVEYDTAAAALVDLALIGHVKWLLTSQKQLQETNGMWPFVVAGR